MKSGETLAFAVNAYLRRKSIDKIGATLRSHLDVKVIPTEKSVIRDQIPPMLNPFALSHITSLTEVQTLMRKFCKEKYFEHLGSIAIQASCGSGKTLTGIYLIRYLRCKTLIISTRNAVIDQWFTQLHTLYPNMKIQTSKSKVINDDADIWILTPQYLNCKNRIESESFSIHPGLIIYDEIHTMLSDGGGTKDTNEREFLNVLKYPFVRAKSGFFPELPYMLGLSATYPEDPKQITRVFGKIWNRKTSITSIPISVYDLRDTVTPTVRGFCDKNYNAPDQYDALEFYLHNIPWIKEGIEIDVGKASYMRKDLKMRRLDPLPNPINLSKELKGIVMTYSIDSSVWGALRIHDLLGVNVLLVRTQDEKSYWFPSDEFIDAEYDRDVNINDLKDKSIGHPCQYQEHIDDAEVIVSTVQRMKEGFSNECLVWGIVTLFPYSQLSRVQICGRVRRSSKNKKIQEATRVLYTNSSAVPSNLFVGRRYNSGATVTYSWEFENKLFEEENIHYISKHMESLPHKE